MTRESLYVVLTRGRRANHAYVATDYTPDPETNHGPDDTSAARDVLTTVLDNTQTDLSAHDTALAARGEFQPRLRALAGPAGQPSRRDITTLDLGLEHARLTGAAKAAPPL